MPKEKMWVEWEDGSDLSQSRKKPGDYSPLTREEGTNRLGQVTLSPVDEEESESDFTYTDGYASDSRATEPSELEKLLGALVLLGAIVALEKAKPHLKRLWNEKALPAIREKALPAIRSAWSKLTRTRTADSQGATTESPTLVEPVPTDASHEVVAALEAYRASMSSAEARDRFVAALVARLFSEEQIRVLRSARIEDEDGPVELMSAADTLTAKQVEDSIRLTLEGNPSLVDAAPLTELGKILGRGQVDGRRVTLNRERIIAALRLTRGGK